MTKFSDSTLCLLLIFPFLPGTPSDLCCNLSPPSLSLRQVFFFLLFFFSSLLFFPVSLFHESFFFHLKWSMYLLSSSLYIYIYIYIYIYSPVPDIGPAVRVFANGPGDLGSIPGRVIPKTLKMELDTTLLNTQHYKVRFKGKVEQSWEWSSALPYTLV